MKAVAWPSGPIAICMSARGTVCETRRPRREVLPRDPYSLLGKILRLDVNMSGKYRIPPDNPFAAGGGRPEVLALGFRNPYRISFDASSQGGHLYVGDVGQALMEEVDIVTPGGNYGWPIREGTTCFNAKDWGRPLSACAHSQLVDPVLEYPHAGKASAIIGGSVYRGGRAARSIWKVRFWRLGTGAGVSVCSMAVRLRRGTLECPTNPRGYP